MSREAAPARIRDAVAADARRLGEIARAAYLKYVPRIGREPAPMGADFAAEIAAGRVVVVEAGGSVAGYMVAWPQADGYFIDNIAADPAAQGRGLGRQLMDHAEQEARRHGLAALRLYTNVAMSENLSLYRRMGSSRRTARSRRALIGSSCGATSGRRRNALPFDRCDFRKIRPAVFTCGSIFCANLPAAREHPGESHVGPAAFLAR